MMSFILKTTRKFKDKVCSESAVTWGDDGSLAIATNNGVIICTMDLRYGINEFMVISRVAADTEHIELCSKQLKMELVAQEERDFHTLPSKLPQDPALLAEILYDRTLNPNQSAAPGLTGIQSVQLSSTPADELGRCIMATLAGDHRLSVFSRKHSHAKWRKIVDISELWLDVIEQNKESYIKPPLVPKNVDKKSFLYQGKLFRDRAFASAFVCVCWSHVIMSTRGHHSLLLAASRTGQVAIFKINHPLRNKSDVECLDCISVANDHPTSLKWCKINETTGMVVIGYLSGRMHYFFTSISESQSYVFSEISTIWDDADEIPVKCIEWNPQTHSLFAAKGIYLVSFILSISSHGNLWKLSVEKATFADVKSSHFINDISLNEGTPYLSTVNCQAFRADLSNELNLTELEKIANQNQYISCGMQFSPNGMLRAQVTHKSHKSQELGIGPGVLPLELHIQSTKDADDIAMFLLGQPGTTTLYNMKDALLVLTLLVYYNQVALPNALKTLKITPSVWNDLDNYTLKLLRYLFLMDKVHIVPLDEKQHAQSLDDITFMLLHQHVEKCLKQIKNKSPEMLTPKDKTNIAIMCAWMKSWSKSNLSWISELEVKLELTAEMSKQTCHLCNTQFSFSNFQSAECSNGHKFQLCSHSIMVCQVPNYRCCPLCKAMSLALSDLQGILLEGVQVFCCQLCDERLTTS